VNSLATIAGLASAGRLPFLLAGGHAVIAHGYPRNTFDLDLIIPRVDRDSWIQLLNRARYSLKYEGPTFLQFDPPQTESLPLDLMLVNPQTFSKMMADAVSFPVASVPAPVVSLFHLLALKCHAIKNGHSGRIVKDADDVIRLLQANQINPNADEIRDLILRHGTTELYEKLRKACS
jgi:hypothetical protein